MNGLYDVAITGIGIVSSLGTGCLKVSRALKEGKSGIVFDKQRQDLGFRGCLTGVISDFDPPEMERKKKKTLPEFGLWTYVAALEAIEMSGWGDEDIQNDMTGLIIGNDSSAIANIRGYEITKEKNSTLNIGANIVFQALNSTLSMNLNSLFGMRGASWTLSGACASGGHAVGQAGDLIRMGRQERIICGGAQEITWESVCSFDATNAFSIRHSDPAKASRPFDKERDGLVPSGGAAMICLERMDLAKKRGADILGKLTSYSFSSDGDKLSVPSGLGIKKAMENVIRQAGLTPEKISYISAHATATPIGDSTEAGAIYSVFGEKGPDISSLKGMTGHEMWMAGASQVVYSVLMNKGKFIAPNINFTGFDENTAKINLVRETKEKRVKNALLNAAGFGGTNSCLLLDFDI